MHAIIQIAHPVMLLIFLKLIAGFYINRGKYKTMDGTIAMAYIFLCKGMLILKQCLMYDIKSAMLYRTNGNGIRYFSNIIHQTSYIVHIFGA